MQKVPNMGQIERLKRITMARIEAFLDTLEKPEHIFPQLVKELKAKVKEAANAEAKSLSAVKGDQRRLDEASGRVIRLEKGAMLAVAAGDMDTARLAVAVQIEAEHKKETCVKSLEISQSAYVAARQMREQLQQNLKDLQFRKHEILMRHRQARLEKQMLERFDKTSIDPGRSILDCVARMEAGIDLDQARIEVQNEISKTLGSTFDVESIEQTENTAEVDRRLDELRKRTSQDN